MNRKFLVLLALAAMGMALLTAGCGGDNKSTETTTAATTTETTPTETTTTETTTTEATTTTETTATTETTDTGANFATTENCRQFAEIGQKISSSLTGSSDIKDIQTAFDQYAEAAPADIKDDFQTLADFFGQVADALGGVKAGQTPSPQQLAKLQSLDSKAATQASQNISAWVQENCT
jgi:hypothetical protein